MVSTKEKVGGAIGAVLLILALIYVIYALLGRPDTGPVIYFCGVAIVGLVAFLVYIIRK